MPDKPTTAAGYRSEHVQLVRATCLYVATKLGDLMDELVVVGGLVPSLIIDQATLPQDTDPHVGTMDLDVGLTARSRSGCEAPAFHRTRTTRGAPRASAGRSRVQAGWLDQVQPVRGVPGAFLGTRVQAKVAGCFRY
jgi:hypothetical protein